MPLTYKDYIDECDEVGIPEDKRFTEDELEDWVWDEVSNIRKIQGDTVLIHCIIDELIAEQQNHRECETCSMADEDGICTIDSNTIIDYFQ